MKKRVLSFLLVVMTMVSIIFAAPMSVHAEENKELDVVMVLDQSGSMNNNDPEGMMLTATNMLIEMMPAKTGRVGVITFSRKQTVVAELTDLDSGDSVNSLINKVNAIEYKGATDIGNAVADAVEMFDLNDERLHAILVLSDGRNDFGIDRNAEQESDERLNKALIEAKNHDCRIYCLGFGEELADTDDVAYKKLLSIASGEDMISTEVEANKIHDFFVKMLADILESKIQIITSNKINIEPNVKEANIYMSSASAIDDVTISLLDPSGNEIELKNSDKVRFYKDKYSAVIKLFTPVAGEYTINTSEEDLEIVVGYIPSYEYVLSSRVLDEYGNEVEKIDNGTTVELQTVIQQDGIDITDSTIYDSLVGKAVVTAKDTDDKEEIILSFEDGKLRSDITFDHEAMYEIDIDVESESFHLEDRLEIHSSRRAISFDTELSTGTIEDKIIDKTMKESVELLVSNDELMSIVSDPDNVGVTINNVVSEDSDKVKAELTNDGVLLTGLKWGSSIIEIEYKDGLGNTITTSFMTKVQDKVKVAIFTMLPVLIGVAILLAVYFVIKKSRMVRGEFEIRKVEIRRGENGSDITIISQRRSYKGSTFAGRKKSFENGINKYAQDVYSIDSTSLANRELYEVFSDTRSAVRANLDYVKLIGSYLGRRGCTLKVKGGAPVAVSNNKAYGKAVKLVWINRATFKIYTKDEEGTEICIEGSYDPQIRRNAAPKNTPKKTKKGTTTKGRTDQRTATYGSDPFSTSGTSFSNNDLDDFFG